MDTVCAFADLWHRSGLRLRVAFPLRDAGAISTAAELANQVDAYLAAGFSVREVGVEPGEESEEVGYVMRTTVDGKSGPCSRIFFYSPNAAVEYQTGSVYLNTPDDVAEFEKQSGLKVQQMPEWPSGAAPKKTDRGAMNFVRQCKGFTVVRKANPKYDATAAAAAAAKREAYTVPKRLFVRYGGQPATKHENVPQTANTATGETLTPHTDDAIVNGFETEIEAAADLIVLAAIGRDIAADSRVTQSGRAYLRGIYDGRKKYLEAMANNSDIPW